jgi:hypothetical protein
MTGWVFGTEPSGSAVKILEGWRAGMPVYFRNWAFRLGGYNAGRLENLDAGLFSELSSGMTGSVILKVFC